MLLEHPYLIGGAVLTVFVLAGFWPTSWVVILLAWLKIRLYKIIDKKSAGFLLNLRNKWKLIYLATNHHRQAQIFALQLQKKRSSSHKTLPPKSGKKNGGRTTPPPRHRPF